MNTEKPLKAFSSDNTIEEKISIEENKNKVKKNENQKLTDDETREKLILNASFLRENIEMIQNNEDLKLILKKEIKSLEEDLENFFEKKISKSIKKQYHKIKTEKFDFNSLKLAKYIIR